jgi:hypothetical protein
VVLVTLKASANHALQDAYHDILDVHDDDQEVAFALMQTHCARQVQRRSDDDDRAPRRPDTPRRDCAPSPTSPTKNNRARQGANGHEPYNKHTRKGAQEGGPSAFFCNFLEDHGVSPTKLLRKAGLAHADWDIV